MSTVGIFQGLGQASGDAERVRQQAIVEALSQAQESRAKQQELRDQAEERRRQRLSDIQTRQMQTGIPQGDPYRASDGKVYQRFLDPNTGQIATREVTEPEAESKVQEVLRQLKQAEASGIVIPQEEKQRIIESALGGRGMLTQPRANKFGSFIADPNSPTGYSREIVDGTTLAPTGQRDYGVPPGYLPKEHTTYRVLTDIDGSQYLQEVTTESRGAGGRGGKGGSSVGDVTSPRGKGGAGGAGVSGNIPPGARPFGHKPLDALGRRSLIAANQALKGVDRLQKIFSTRPELKGDNNPFGPHLSWFEYQKLNINPGGIRGELIKEAALIGITASGLYSQGRMSRYLFDKAQQHLPQPDDTPSLLWSKIEWLKRNHILDDMIKDIKNPFRDESSAPQDFHKATINVNGKEVPVDQP